MFPPAGCFLRLAPTFQSFLGTAVAESGPPTPQAGAIAIKRLTQGHVFYIRRRVHAVQHSGGSCWSNWSEYNAGYLAREQLAEGNGCSLRAWGRNHSLAKLPGRAGTRCGCSEPASPLPSARTGLGWGQRGREGALCPGEMHCEILLLNGCCRGLQKPPAPGPIALSPGQGNEQLKKSKCLVARKVSFPARRALPNRMQRRLPPLRPITHAAGLFHGNQWPQRDSAGAPRTPLLQFQPPASTRHSPESR